MDLKFSKKHQDFEKKQELGLKKINQRLNYPLSILQKALKYIEIGKKIVSRKMDGSYLAKKIWGSRCRFN